MPITPGRTVDAWFVTHAIATLCAVALVRQFFGLAAGIVFAVIGLVVLAVRPMPWGRTAR